MMLLMSMEDSIASQNGDKIVRKTQYGPFKKKKEKISLHNILETKVVNELLILVNFPVENLLLIHILQSKHTDEKGIYEPVSTTVTNSWGKVSLVSYFTDRTTCHLLKRVLLML